MQLLEVNNFWRK